jgi:hypothetical protein
MANAIIIKWGILSPYLPCSTTYLLIYLPIDLNIFYVTTLALGSRPKQGVARLRAKREA